MTDKHTFSREYVDNLLRGIEQKTLEEIDVNHVFDITITNPKVTGISGMVIEQSVFGYDQNSDKNPDLIIDGEECELKTTGVRKKKDDDGTHYVPKEPVSITGVSINTIVDEEFYSSHFWKKCKYLLFVLYEYLSNKPVPSSEYRNFPIIGYFFNRFSKEDELILKKDWELVRDFLIECNKSSNPEELYPLLFSTLQNQLDYIDTSPKYPHPPRFRFRRSFITTLTDEYFNKKKLEVLDQKYQTISDFDKQCHLSSEQYKGKTFKDLMVQFGIEKKEVSKDTSEQFVVRMFGGKSKKISNLEFFVKHSIIGKTITLTKKCGRTEDMKLFTIDFEEIQDPNLQFEDSQFYDYFTSKFLFSVFQEPYDNSPLEENIFRGFKKYSFKYDFVDTYVRGLWERLRDLVNNNKLKETPTYKKDGTPRINKTGVPRVEINFPKSSDDKVLYVKGTSGNSLQKPFVLNGIKMYHQQVWIKGIDIIQYLKEEPYV